MHKGVDISLNNLKTANVSPFRSTNKPSKLVTARCLRKPPNSRSSPTCTKITCSAHSQSTTAQIPDYPTEEDVTTWVWSGSDQFSHLDDRKNLPPLPLPSLPGQRRRIVLVRHGQSTWNARSRIQGSSDFSVLTEEGVRQAEAAAAVLENWKFDVLFASPLKRAARTAHVVWGARQGPQVVLPSLREVDLYSFQGLDKAAGRSAHPEAYETWQQRPAQFTIDGHWPVRELWHRASLAWQEILLSPHISDTALVVAHNAVNQALICTALGLTPLHFRRITQTNAAFSELEFEWDKQGNVSVRVDRLNYFPEGPLRNEKLGRAGADRLVLVSGAAKCPNVAKSLRLISSVGVTAPPLVAVGTAEAQAADIGTALRAVLGTPRPAEGRHVVAVASPEACKILLSECLGAPGVGENFELGEGGITVFNYHRRMAPSDDIGQGLLLCSNFLPPPQK